MTTRSPPARRFVPRSAHQPKTAPASSVLQSTNGLGASLGVAGVGAIFFAITGTGGTHNFVHAGEWTALASTALLAAAFVIAFGLPRHARNVPQSPDAAIEPEAAIA